MLYISRDRGDGFYGITDTDDGVEEFYDRDQILAIIKKLGNVIKGAVHTGSDIRITVHNENTLFLENLEYGQPFTYCGKNLVYVRREWGAWRVFNMDVRKPQTLRHNQVFGDKSVTVSALYDEAKFAEFKAWFRGKYPDQYSYLFPKG